MSESRSDQAEKLRKLVEKKDSQKERDEISSLPPRSEVHRGKKIKKKQRQIKFPLVRFLLVLFIIIVILAGFSEFWIDDLYNLPLFK